MFPGAFSYRTALILLLLATRSVAVGAAENSLPDLIALGAPTRQAELVAIEANGDLGFRDVADKAFSIPLSNLIRWSTPTSPRARDELILRDGSRICLAAAWAGESSFGTGRVGANALTRALGEVELQRSMVRAVFWQLPPNAIARQKRIDSLLNAQAKVEDSDLLLLDNGDVLTGTLTRIGQAGINFDGEEDDIRASFFSPLGAIELPIERVRGICLSQATDVPPSNRSVATPALLVGLRDGSLIATDSVAYDGNEVKLRSAVLGEKKGVALKEVVSLQTHNKEVLYLADLDAAGYRHEPYFDLAWPYRRDRNALGAPLQTGGRTYPIGLGMHSAARLTFELDGSYDRFAATVAVDDAAKDGGSVVFRVFLRSGEDWQEAYASGIVRGGDPPADLAVDLAGASQLALAVDYADRGDERDYANWLDARLERAE